MKQVLVVDNHPVIRRFMSDFLVSRGHSVLTAEDGLSALEILDSYTPEVIFIDLVMPNISGNKLCQIIRRRRHLDGCLIVILSAIAVEEELFLSDLGADMILAKGPLDKLSGHVDHIMAQVEAGQAERLKGAILGREDLYERQITKELLAAKKHYETTLFYMSEGLVELLADGQIVYANPAALSIIGIAEENLLSADFASLFRNGDQELIGRRLCEAVRTGSRVVVDKILSLGGRQVSPTIIPIREEDRQYTLVVMLRDVTRQQQAEQDLREREEKYKRERNFLRNIFENSPDAIAIVDQNGRFTRWNHKAAEIFGYKFEELKGKQAWQLFTDKKELDRMVGRLEEAGSVQNYEVTVARKDGTPVPCAFSLSMLYDENHEQIGILSIIRDLTEWKQVEERLRYLSFHDSLTGVYNRAFFEEEMKRLATRRHLPLGIIICDIDRLKRINDTMGHQMGDAMIAGAAGILKQCFRTSDVIARIGGDEFAVLLPKTNLEVITQCIGRIREMTADFRNRHPELNLSMSIGYAIGSKLPIDTQALFKAADDQMYMEKPKSS